RQAFPPPPVPPFGVTALIHPFACARVAALGRKYQCSERSVGSSDHARAIGPSLFAKHRCAICRMATWWLHGSKKPGQSRAKCLIYLVAGEGFEPSTFGL